MFKGVTLSSATSALMSGQPTQAAQVFMLNRLLLDDLFPQYLPQVRARLTTLNLNLANGGNTFYVQGTSAWVTNLSLGTGANAVGIGTNAHSTFNPATDLVPKLDDHGNPIPNSDTAYFNDPTNSIIDHLYGNLNILGSGRDSINLDDTGSTVGKLAVTDANSIAFNGLGVISFNGISSMVLSLGQGADQVQMDSTFSVATSYPALFTASDLYPNFSQLLTTLSTNNSGVPGYLWAKIQTLAPNQYAILTSTTATLDAKEAALAAALNTVILQGASIYNQSAFLGVKLSAPTSNLLNSITLSPADTARLNRLLLEDAFPNLIVKSLAAPVILINGDGGNDVFAVFDTHAVVELNGGNGGDTFYIFANTSPMALNGDDGDDSFYIFASITSQQADASVNGGSGNAAVFNYRQNGHLNIDGGTGFNRLFVFGTILDDTITIDGNTITGAGLDITFQNISELDIAGLQGSDTFYIKSIITPTRILGDANLPNFPSWIRIPPHFFDGRPLSIVGIVPPGQTAGLNQANGNGVLSQDFNYTISFPDLGLSASLTVTAASSAADQSPADLAKLILNAINQTIFAGEFTVSYDPNSHQIMLQLIGSQTENDTFFIGWRDVVIPNTGVDLPLPGTLSGIMAPLSIAAGAADGRGIKTIWIDDSGDRLNQSYTLTTIVDTQGLVDQVGAVIAQFNSPAMGPNGVIYWDKNADNVNISLSSGNNTVTINGNIAGRQTTINGGGLNDRFTINSQDPATGLGLLSPLLLNGNNNDFFGDTLTLNGGPGGNDFVISGSSIDGAGAPGATLHYQNIEYLTVNGLAGTNSYTVNGTSVPTVINGGPNADLFVVNSNIVPLTFNGLNGADTFIINGNSGLLTVNGGNGGANTFIVNGSAATTVLNGGAKNDAFTINGNNALLTANGGAGDDSFTVNATSSPLTLNAGAGNDTFTVSLLIAAVVTAKGGGASDVLTVNGSLGAETITIGAGSIISGLSPVDYSQMSGVTVNGNGGNDTFVLVGTSATTTVNGADGNDTFNVRQINSSTTLNPAGGINTINIGSSAPFPLSITDLIQGVLTINGHWQDTLNVDDTGSTGPKSGTLSATALTGLGMTGGIVYHGLTALNISLGTGGNTFVIAGTSTQPTILNSGYGNDTIDIQAIGGPTTVNTGAGVNTVNVGSSLSMTGGVVSGIQGLLVINGNGSDTMNLDDTGTTVSRTGLLTSSTISRLGMGTTGSPGMTYQVQFSTDLMVWNVLDVVTSSSPTVSWNAPNLPATMGFYRVVELMPTGPNLPISPGISLAAGHIRLSWANNIVPPPPSPLPSGGILYSGLSALNLSLGSGGNTFTVASTASGTTTTVNSGAGNDLVNIQTIASALNINTGLGVNTINLGSLASATGGTVNTLQGPITLTGSGADTLNVDNTGTAAATTGTLTSTQLTGLGLGTGGVTYSGLAFLNITLGNGGNTFAIVSTYKATVTTLNTGAGNDTVNLLSNAGLTNLNTQAGNDTVNVQTTAAALNINTGTGVNTVNLGSLAPATGGVVDQLQGAITVTGSGADILNVDDTGSTLAKTGSLTSTQLTGLGSGGVTYSGLSTLNISLGSGGNTFTITTTATLTATTVNSGNGNDVVLVLSNSSPLNISTQAGNDVVSVRSTNAPLNLATGTGADVINLGSLAPASGGVVDNLQGVVTIVGDGADTLNVDDSGNATAKTATLTGSALTGMGLAGINYSGLGVLNILLGTGNDTMNVRGTSAVTSINAGAGTNTLYVGSLAPAVGGVVNAIQGALTLIGSGADTLNVDDTGSSANKTGTLTPTTITGLGMATGGITYAGIASLNINLGSGNDSFTVNEINVPTFTTVNGGPGVNGISLNFAQDFSGNLVLLNFQNGNLAIGRDFLGTLSDTGPGGLQTVTVGRNFLGTFTAGTVNLMTIGGNAPGRIYVGSMGTLYAAADTGNTLLDITQAGIRRQILAIPVTGATMPASVVFTFVYDGASGPYPQVAIRINNPSPSTIRFDLSLVTFDTTAKFNLSRLDAKGVSGLRNIGIGGDLLLKVTAAEITYMGYAGNTTGGVVLPSDNLTGVEVRDDAKVASVQAQTIMGVSFATITGSFGTVLATDLEGLDGEDILTFGTRTVLATGVFRVPFGGNLPDVLFLDTNNSPQFNDPEVVFTNELPNNPILSAIVTMFGPTGPGNNRSVIQSINFIGDGGSVSTGLQVTNAITSTGSLGDLYLSSGTGIANISASSFFGNVNLYGGNLTGTFQSTGIRIDPLTGAQTSVAADIGSVITNASGTITGVTTLNLNMTSAAMVISRGNLISQFTSNTALLGTIAAQGDIGVIQKNSDGTATVNSRGQITRFGGLSFGSGTSTGDVLALGNILGDITIGGPFSGRIGAQGAAISGIAASRTGILGRITIRGNLNSTGAVISSGEIGDSIQGTTLNFGTFQGFVAAIGPITFGSTGTLSSARIFQNLALGSANALAINNIWTNGGVALLFDINPGDLAGLSLIVTDLNLLRVSGTSLTGTTP